MAITASVVRITLKYTYLGQKCQTVQHYTPIGAAWLTADAIGGATAWWNDIKAAWRACIVTSSNFEFDTVLFEEIGGGGGFAEYAVPLAEKQGTRAVGSLGDWLAPFTAVGCKQVVGTRVTRPGQKRFPGAMEGDNQTGSVNTTYLALIDPLAAKYSTMQTMGAPVATGNLTPIVASYDAGGAVIATQPITGYLLRTTFTTQVSRRQGHGN